VDLHLDLDRDLGKSMTISHLYTVAQLQIVIAQHVYFLKCSLLIHN
jgi:hypothetical protein